MSLLIFTHHYTQTLLSTAAFPREFIAARVEIARTRGGVYLLVLFNDAGTFQAKCFRQDGTVEVIAGNGFEGNNEGKSRVLQLASLCTENSNVFVTVSQTGCVKLIATTSGSVIFFKQLAKLYRTFSVHLKHQVGYLKRFLDGTFSTVQESFNSSQKATNDPEGTVSNQTLKSV